MVLRRLSIAALWIVSLLVAWSLGFLSAQSQTPDSALIQGMDGKSWAEASAEFDRRVKSRFPIGTAESDLSRQLMADGFDLMTWSPQAGEDKVAMLSWLTLTCRQQVAVYWQADSAGKISNIGGSYGEGGCL
jgi:hypothetical protein